MISHKAFGRLRLPALLPEETIWEMTGYELLDRLWIVQGFNAFTTIGRLEEEPDVARVMEICLSELTAEQAKRIMDAVGLELRQGMSLDELIDHLGRPVRKRLRLSDRCTYEFDIGGPEPYEVSCTVLDDGGLLFVTVHPPLPPDRDE
jgi:hypothetical protein